MFSLTVLPYHLFIYSLSAFSSDLFIHLFHVLPPASHSQIDANQLQIKVIKNNPVTNQSQIQMNVFIS